LRQGSTTTCGMFLLAMLDTLLDKLKVFIGIRNSRQLAMIA
jgi:hypothetical protein